MRDFESNSTKLNSHTPNENNNNKKTVKENNNNNKTRLFSSDMQSWKKLELEWLIKQ